jgi:hypothetical protein
VAEFIAEAMALSESLPLAMVTLKLEPPREICNVPDPTLAVPEPAKAPDRSCCAEASCEMLTLYVPTGAPEVAVAVKAVELVFAVSVSNALGVSSVLSEA